MAGIDFSADGVIKSVEAAGSAVSTDSVFSNVDGGSLVFKEGSRAESYVIQYFQSIDNISDYSGETITNKVDISNEDGPLDETEEPADVPKTYEVEKDGYLGADGKMHYTVSFINLWEADLNELTDKTITDVLTFTRKDGTPVDASKFTVELETPSYVTINSSVSGNTITTTFTINGSNGSERVDVHYTVTPTGGSFTSDYGYTLNNTAQWQGDTDDDVTDIEKSVELGPKTAKFIADHNVIEWTFVSDDFHWVDLELKLGNETYTGLYPVKDGRRLEFDVTINRTYSWALNDPSNMVNIDESSGDNNADPAVYRFKSVAVNDDMRVYAYFVANNQACKLKAVTVTNGNALAGTQNEFDTTGLIPVQTLTLSEENGWTAEYDGLIENGAYYYAVEKEVDGYETVYVVNGIDNGVIQIVNNIDTVPRGSITVNKSWLGDEPDARR